MSPCPNFLSRLSLLLLVGFAMTASAYAQSQEHVILSGGPALRKWENLRAPGTQHDRWWGNFIRPARIRIQELQAQNPNALITWLVYRRAFANRSLEDNRNLIELVESVRDKYHVRLVWIDSGDDVIRYINSGQPRSRVKISSFDFFGHSNKYCFMFDYSGEIYGVSKAYLHQRDLHKINGGAFTKDAFCKSWGCHSGESMTRVWRKSTGVAMIGAHGKTDYANPDGSVSLSWGGHWTKG